MKYYFTPAEKSAGRAGRTMVFLQFTAVIITISYRTNLLYMVAVKEVVVVNKSLLGRVWTTGELRVEPPSNPLFPQRICYKWPLYFVKKRVKYAGG